MCIAEHSDSSNYPRNIRFLTWFILYNLFALFLEAQLSAQYHMCRVLIITRTLNYIHLFDNYLVGTYSFYALGKENVGVYEMDLVIRALKPN